MARGGTKTAEDTAASIGKTAAANTGTLEGQSGQAYSSLMPQIQQMLSPQGDPAVTAATLGALGSQFGSAKQGVMDTAARTGNAASTNASLDQLARTQGTVGAQTAANNVAQQHESADKLLSGIYSGDVNATNQSIGQQTNANNSYIGGIKTGNGVLGSILKAYGQAAGAVGQAATGGGG